METETSIQLEVSLPQAEAIITALETLTRLSLGQIWIVGEHLRSGIVPTHKRLSEEQRLDAISTADALAHEFMRALGFHSNSSLGIGHQRQSILGIRAYEVKKVLEKTIAEHRDPNPSFRCTRYDGLMLRYTQDPAPVAKAIKSKPSNTK